MDSSSSNGIPRPAAALGIDYLAKDYASFRQLMLDRLASLVPDWSERNAADVGVMVVELLASSEGLGFMIVYGRQLFQLDVVLAAVVVVGAVGYALDKLLAAIEVRLLGWRKEAF